MTMMLVEADEVAPKLSVTVSLATTVPAAEVMSVAVGSVTEPEKLAPVPLSIVHA